MVTTVSSSFPLVSPPRRLSRTLVLRLQDARHHRHGVLRVSPRLLRQGDPGPVRNGEVWRPICGLISITILFSLQ